ncbi:MAG: hypothetical protein KBA30_11415, partial [Clostridia bacterium]|nr:hypothetical protein [Clostridia bacterium]
TYTYRIVEVAGSETGMTYDPMVIEVTVAITDAGNGVLNMVPTYPADTVFDNTYEAAGEIALEADKTLTGRLLQNAEFTFQLQDSVGTVMQTKQNDVSGNVVFDALNYTQADIGQAYTYRIVEVAGTETGMTYDPMVIEMTVAVTDAGNGVLVATPSYPTDTVFDNLYQNPGIRLVKTAQNLTTGGPAVDGSIVSSVINDRIRYSVTIVNTGNMPLQDVMLTDDLVEAGTEAMIDGLPAAWEAGASGGPAWLNVGTLASGESMVVSYEYSITAQDALTGIRVNTAAVTANARMVEILPDTGGTGTYLLPLTDEDDAVVTAEDIPLSGVPSILVTKTVRNRTTGGLFGEIAGGKPGDVFEYRLVVMNNGEESLADVWIHDDRAVAGSAVLVNGIPTVWAAGTDGKATVLVGTLAVGSYATLTYETVSTAADEDTARVNTAYAEGTVERTLPNSVPTEVTSNIDTAMFLVDTIPESGEATTKTRMLAGLTILTAAAAGVILKRKRGRREEPNDMSID